MTHVIGWRPLHFSDMSQLLLAVAILVMSLYVLSLFLALYLLVTGILALFDMHGYHTRVHFRWDWDLKNMSQQL